MSNVHIEVDGRGQDGRIIIDGHDIAKSTCGFTIRSEVGHVPQLELTLRSHGVTSFAAPHVQVLIDSTTAEYLERAGWTPPPGVASVLDRRDDGCPCQWIEVWEGPDGRMVTSTATDAERREILGRTVPTCPVHGVNARKAGTNG